MVSLGSLFLKVVPVGLDKTLSLMSTLNTEWGKLQGKMGPQLKNLSKNFKKFGVIAGAAFGAMLLASPRLRAEMSLLAVRTRELIRPFGDALAPAIRTVTDLITGLTAIFKGLPEPIQNIITVAAAFAVVVGVVGTALVILPAIFNPVTLAIVGIGLALGILLEIWNSNWLNIQGIAETVIGTITGIIDGFLKLIQGLPAAAAGILTQLLATFQETGKNIGTAITNLFQKPINDFLEFVTGFGDKLLAAGAALIAAFFTGAQKALKDAGKLLSDVLDWLFGFFGGSLPERGPLVAIPEAGQELGEAYSLGISKGVDATSISESFTRIFNVRNVNVAMPAAAGDPKTFVDRLDTGLRRATSW